MALLKAIVLGLALTGGIHIYVWWRLVRSARLPRRWHVAATVVLALLFLSVPITTWSRYTYPELAETVGWVSLTWMALAGLMFVWFVFIDVSRLVGRGVAWIGGRLGRRAVNVPAPEPSL